MSTEFQCVTFALVLKDEIFFQDLDTDNFSRSTKCLIKMIRNKDQQFLVVDEELLKFESRNQRQCRSEDCQFNIDLYMNDGCCMMLGQPVILTVSDSGNSRMVCCREKGDGEREVYAKLQESPLPKYIKNCTHEAIFFLQATKERINGFRLESSLWPHWFLTFKMDDENLVKLVLGKMEDDVVDEGFVLENLEES